MARLLPRIHTALVTALAATLRRFGPVFRLVRAALEHRNRELLREILLEKDRRLLHALLSDSDHRLLRDVLLENDRSLLRMFLCESDYHLLREFVFENDGKAFRRFATENRQEALRRLLHEDNYRLLRSLLDREGRCALQAVLFADGYVRFMEMASKQQAAPLVALFASDDGKEVLHRILRQMGPEDTAALLRSHDYRWLRDLMVHDVLAEFLRRNGCAELRRMLLEHDLVPDVLRDERLRGVVVLEQTRRAFEPALSPESARVERFAQARRAIRSEDHIHGRFLDAVLDGDNLPLSRGVVRIPDRTAIWSLLHEIMLHEDYYFACGTDTPRILDCGAHVGMAIYYFKSIYPKARIIAFEPAPELRAVAQANIERNGFTDVELLPYALFDTRGTTTFHLSEDYTMAGSLHPRRREMGETVRSIGVECRVLSDYLREPVHFLKLDIEGTEDIVLAEAEPWLRNVQHLFCEYHHGAGLANGRLARILAILDRAGFEVNVDKSFSYGGRTRCRPMTALGGPASEVIWARNLNWLGRPPGER